MKKLFLLSLLLIGTLTSVAQDKSKSKPKPKVKDVDEESNVVMDSLSKVYKVKVQSYMIETYNGVTTKYISYVKDGKLVYIIVSPKKD
jgi:hypothetical protein